MIVWYNQFLVKVHVHHIKACLWPLSWHKHLQLVVSVKFIYVFHILSRLRCCISVTCPAVPPRAVLREPVGDSHGEAEDTQADAVHFRGDGDVGKKGMVPTYRGGAALKVFDDVKDLLALRLPHHPTYVQQGGDMLFPVESKDIWRRMKGKVDGCYWDCLVSFKAVPILSQISLSHSSEFLLLCFWETTQSLVSLPKKMTEFNITKH